MQSSALTTEQYVNELTDDRKTTINQLRKEISEHLPEGFQECMNYGMIGYVVPHSIYPDGYHCDPKLPLPFLGLASQKNAVSFYHMGLYANKELMDWFIAEYPKHTSAKLDMGKSCIRFKKPEHIPYALIGELVSKMSVRNWIDIYEELYKK